MFRQSPPQLPDHVTEDGPSLIELRYLGVERARRGERLEDFGEHCHPEVRVDRCHFDDLLQFISPLKFK